MKLKVCGNRENIAEVHSLKPDYMGFIFYKGSKRCIAENDLAEEISSLKQVSKIGVFVNENLENIVEKIKIYKLDLIQLHGDESLQDCEEARKHLPIIKVLNGDSPQLQYWINWYQPYCDYFLFDYKTSEQYGGTGKNFNWDILPRLKVTIPFFVSGGISIENILQLNKISTMNNFFGIDVNSQFETIPGKKDITKLNKLKKML